MPLLQNKGKLKVAAGAFAAVALVVGIVGCAPKANMGNPTPVVTTPTSIPEKNSFGIIGTKSWKDQYPNQYNSFMENDKNPWPRANGKGSRNAKYPEMVTLGKGYGYAKFFYEAGGHTSSMYTATHNGRVNEKTKAGCLACKTPDVHEMAARDGKGVWQLNMFKVAETVEDGITCAMCHENENPGKMHIERADWVRALGSSINKRSASGEACGQCHCDYSMDPVTGEPTSPYDSVEGMTPERALKWYDDHNYVDWTYPETGAKMIAVRHSEFEYNYGGDHGNHMTQLGYDCADCHMAVKTDEKGNAYHSHFWQSPLKNEELLKKDCSKCHKDLKAEVKAWQDEIYGRTHQLGMRCASFVQNFVAGVRAGTINEADMPRLRQIQREATFYWNSSYAENSKGAHFPARFREVLDRCEALLNEGDKILGVESSADKFVSEYDPAKEYQFKETAKQYYDAHDQR